MTDVDWEYINIELEESADSLTEITKTHWIQSDSRSTCNNNACKKKFTLLERKHHCRRCGEVFCNTCLQFRGRLSFLAQYDPNGKLYKVCSTCFEEGADNDLTTNSLTKLYKEYKEDKKKPKTTDGLGQSSKLKSSRDRLDLLKECKRLREGFIKSVGNSEMKRTLHEMKVLISTPNWQKSSIWMVESLSERCQTCISGFGLLKTKYTCKLCGVVLCKQCIHKEMLVYIPDGCDIKTVQLAELVIIKVVGSPEVEPELSLLLHVCSPCKQFLMNKQITEHEESVRAKTKQVTVIDSLELIDEKLSPLQYKIVNQLSKYQEVVESLEDGSRSSGDGSNTKVLAKSQDDLSDFFSELVLKLPSVKKLQDLAETPTQHKFLKNYLKAKSDFYIQNINTFKALKRKLSESAGPQILEYIQRIVDKNAIVSAQIYVRQLVFESLYLCQKYSLKGVVPDLLNTLDETIENDATKCLTSQGEDMTEHSEHLKNIVKSQIKGHRLVRISKTQYAAQGSKHVAELLLRRLSDILGQVNVQLQMKSINRSFQPTKSALEKCRSEAVQLTINDLL